MKEVFDQFITNLQRYFSAKTIYKSSCKISKIHTNLDVVRKRIVEERNKMTYQCGPNKKLHKLYMKHNRIVEDLNRRMCRVNKMMSRHNELYGTNFEMFLKLK